MPNCKQGEMAVIVRSLAGNEGKIVRCVRPVLFFDGVMGAGLRWVTDPAVPGMFGELAYPPLDANMRPIRWQEGEDEMLRIVGSPVGTPQAA